MCSCPDSPPLHFPGVVLLFVSQSVHRGEWCGHSNGTLSVRRPFILEGTKGTRPASRGTSPEIPSSRTGARSLIICISFAVTLHLIHEINGRHRLLFHPPPSPTSSTFSSMRCLQQLGSNRRRNDPCLDTRCQRQDQDVPHARFAADSRAAGASWRAHATLQHASTLRMRQADTGSKHVHIAVSHRCCKHVHVASHLVSSHLVSSHLVSSCLISSHLVSSRLVS